jgi:hypothetical protein
MNPLSMQHQLREFELFIQGLGELPEHPVSMGRSVSLGKVTIDLNTGEIVPDDDPSNEMPEQENSPV